MKLAFFIPSLSGGGAERVILNLIQGFTNYDMELELITAYDDGVWQKSLSENCKVVNLNKRHVFQSLLPLINYLNIQKPDILISAIDNANIINILACKLSNTNTKSIISIHQISSKFRELHGNFKERTIHYITKLVFPVADKMIVVSSYVKNDILSHIKIDEKRIVVIGNPIVSDDEIKIHSNTDRKNKNSFNIFAAGRLEKEKDFDTLIRAFNLIFAKLNAKLTIYGEGSEHKHLLNLCEELGISEQVSLPGFVENIFYPLRESDLCVVSSITEGFSNVIVEALACGVSVVSTDCGGPREILCDGEYGILVPVQNAKLLADAMIQARSIEGNSQKLKNRAMDFSIDKITKEYWNVIQDILSEGE